MLFFFNESFTLTASLFERALAVLNCICFLSSYAQYEGLISSQGIAPAADALQRYQRRGVTFLQHPTLCLYLSASDSVLFHLHLVGLLASVLAFFGILTGPCLLTCALCYQSLKNVSGPFLGLQMHANLVETDLLYTFASPFLLSTPLPLILSQIALLSRVMLGGALGKWTGGDSSWRDLTAMSYHYWTQPLPNPLSSYFHRLPLAVHKLESAMTFVLEGGGAVLCWGPPLARGVAFLCFAAILFMINVSGSYGFLAQMTMTEAVCLLNDDALSFIITRMPAGQLILRFLHATFHSPFAPSRWLGLDWLFSLPGLSLLPFAATLLYALLGLVPLATTCQNRNPLHLLVPLSPTPLLIYTRLMSTPPFPTLTPLISSLYSHLHSLHPHFQSFDLALRYVKFGHMTKRRYELCMQTSHDGHHWVDVQWKAKPGELGRRPPVLGPHIWMLDWRLWFLGNEHARGMPPPDWYMRLMRGVLEGRKEVLGLLRGVGGGGGEGGSVGVRWVRTLVYDYRYVWGSEVDVREREVEEARRRKRRKAKEEDGGDEVEDEAGMQAWRAAKRERKEREKMEGDTVVINPHDWWYRLRFVGQYGPTLHAGEDDG